MKSIHQPDQYIFSRKKAIAPRKHAEAQSHFGADLIHQHGLQFLLKRAQYGQSVIFNGDKNGIPRQIYKKHVNFEKSLKNMTFLGSNQYTPS